MTAEPVRLALLTGGSRGLGAALRDELVARGWHVLEFSRSAPTPDSVRVDLAQPVAVAEAVHAALCAIDPAMLAELLVIHNAATVQPLGPAARQPVDAVVEALNTSLVSGIAFLSAAIAHYQGAACRKVAVHITSGAAVRAHAGLSIYSAAKAGMDQFIQVLAAEQATERHPFIAVSVDPGALDTGMQAALRGASEADFPASDDFERRHREGRLGRPRDVAADIVGRLTAGDLQAGERVRVG